MSSLKTHFDAIWARRALGQPTGRSLRAGATAARLVGGAWLADLGAGTGELIELTRGRFQRGVAVELSLRPLRLARTRGVLGVQADFSEAALPFASESLDALACLSALQYADNPRPVIAECHRVLRSARPVSSQPAGQLALILPNMRTLVRIFKLAALGRFPTVSRDMGYDGGTRHYFCAGDVFDLLSQGGFRVQWHAGLVTRPALAALLPEKPALLRRWKAEFFCAEMLVVAEKQ